MTAVAALVGDAQKAGETVDSFFAEKRRLLREDLQGSVEPHELLLGSVVKGLRSEFHDLVGTLVSTDNASAADMDEVLSKLRDKESMHEGSAKQAHRWTL